MKALVLGIHFVFSLSKVNRYWIQSPSRWTCGRRGDGCGLLPCGKDRKGRKGLVSLGSPCWPLADPFFTACNVTVFLSSRSSQLLSSLAIDMARGGRGGLTGHADEGLGAKQLSSAGGPGLTLHCSLCARSRPHHFYPLQAQSQGLWTWADSVFLPLLA